MTINRFPKTYLHTLKCLFLATTFLLFGCSDDDSDDTPNSVTITVGVFLLNGTTYTDTNKDLIFYNW